MTAAEFQELPLDDSPYQYELHHGEVVTMSRPKSRHFKLQVRLTQLLRPTAEHLGIVELEVPFRAVPQFDFRAADVVFVSRERWDAVDPNDNLRGAPELVIEVKSESNTWAELRERASLCLANGCLDFWILDDKARTVTTIAPDGKPLLFSETECVPLRLFGSNCLPVSEIFG
ncbi:MAG: Uma2 family endonuclease [Bryobacteraceae bacterium]